MNAVAVASRGHRGNARQTYSPLSTSTAYVMPEANAELLSELEKNKKKKREEWASDREDSNAKREAMRCRVDLLNQTMPFFVHPDTLPRRKIDLVCGIYFLYLAGNVVYVGQSVDVHSRVRQHARGKQFDDYTFIRCQEQHMDILEAVYIQRLRPPLNGNDGNVRGSQLRKMGVSCWLEHEESA